MCIGCHYIFKTVWHPKEFEETDSCDYGRLFLGGFIYRHLLKCLSQVNLTEDVAAGKLFVKVRQCRERISV